MSDEKPQDASEGGIGQSASTAGLERTFVSNEFEHPEPHWKWTPLEMRWINERITRVIMAERDACAKLAETMAIAGPLDETHGKYEVAQAIRMELARGKAAQAWCKDTTSHKEMDVELAEAFAEILDEIWSKPWLGNATTAEMLDELRTRAEMGGYSNYRTVDA